MEIITSIEKMQKLSLKFKREGKKLGFIPTMGCLHEGHLSLVDFLAVKSDILILSIFVNPTQFGEGEDLEQYPRTFEEDVEKSKARGVDIIFAPKADEMYEFGFSTQISESNISNRLCGKSRPDHFNGVVTVCTKLFNICQPDFVSLGQKDAQQVAVLKKLVNDLNIPLSIEVGEIIREHDGLAMSSRNTYLNHDERKDALVLSKALDLAKSLVDSGCNKTNEIKEELGKLFKSVSCARVDYVEIVDSETMEFQRKVLSENSLLMLAVWINKVRLIDNRLL